MGEGNSERLDLVFTILMALMKSVSVINSESTVQIYNIDRYNAVTHNKTPTSRLCLHCGLDIFCHIVEHGYFLEENREGESWSGDKIWRNTICLSRK